jgi:hypothetical protein
MELWHTGYSPTDKRLYIQGTNAIRSYPQLTSRTPKFNRNSSRTEQAFPPDATPITVTNIPTLTTTGIAATSANPITTTPTVLTSPNTPQQLQSLDAFSQCPNLPDSLHDSIADGPGWHRAYMQHLEVCVNFQAKFTLAYSRGSLHSVSDGSAPHHGSFAWKLVDALANNFTLAQGGGNCCNFPGLTSHRMESSGVLGIDLFLAHVQATFQLPAYDGTIYHVCDNLEAVNRGNATHRRHTTKYGLHDMDIHTAIESNLTNIPPRKLIWIEGHQDDTTDPANLSGDALLNIEVDALANAFYSHSPTFLPPPPVTMLYHNRIPITWNTRRFLQRHHGAEDLRKFIMEEHPHWTPETFESIAWSSFFSALKKLKDFERTRIIKFVNRWSATAIRMNDRDKSVNPRCPNCMRTATLPSPYDEDEDHVLRCQNATILEARCQSLAQLERTLTALDTPKDVHAAILYGLERWFDNEQYYGAEPAIEWPPPTFQYHPTEHAPIQAAFELQCEIGWDEFLRGRIASSWGTIMHSYYRRLNLPAHRNGTTWTVRVISSTWDIFLKTWLTRNGLKHGADDTENRQIRERDIDQQIRNAYTYDRNCIPPQHSALFTNINDTVSKSLDTKIHWLHSIRSAKSAWINLLHQGAQNGAADQPPPLP